MTAARVGLAAADDSTAVLDKIYFVFLCVFVTSCTYAQIHIKKRASSGSHHGTMAPRAHGVVASHPLRMRKALGSNPNGSILQPGCMEISIHLIFAYGTHSSHLCSMTVSMDSKWLRAKWNGQSGD